MTGAPDTTPTGITHDGGGPGAPARTVVAAPTGGSSQEALPWVLAFLPLGTALFHSVANAMGLHQGLVSAATLAGSAALVIMDKRELARTGRLAVTAAPYTAWFLFPPGYLRRRAKLLGEPSGRFWIALACLAVAFAAQTAVFASGAADLADAVPSAPVLPACTEEANMPDVIDTFSDVKTMRDAGVRGVVLTDRAEIAGGEQQVPPLRFCSGTMQASNGEDYPIRYGFEIVEGRVIVHVQLQ